MKRMTLFFLIVLILTSSFLSSCEDNVFESADKPKKIVLDKTLIEYDKFSQVENIVLQLTAKVTKNDNTETYDNISWDVPVDEMAFKVITQSNGRLSFQILQSGTYTVTAKAMYNGKAVCVAECVISIKDALQSLNIKNAGGTQFSSSMTMQTGSSVILMPVFSPENTSQKDVDWSVDDSSLVSLNPQTNGNVAIVALKQGTAKLTLKSKNNTQIYKQITVYVTAEAVNAFGLRSISSGKSSLNIPIGSSETVVSTVIDGSSNVLSTGNVEYSLSNTESFSLSNKTARSVVVKADKDGSGVLTMTFTQDGVQVSGEVLLTVTGAVKNLNLSSSYIGMQVGETETVKVYSNDGAVQKGFVITGINNTSLILDSSSDNEFTIRALSQGYNTLRITSIHNSSVYADLVVNVKEEVTGSDRVQKIVLGNSVKTFYPPYQSGTVDVSVFKRKDSGEVSIDSSAAFSASSDNSEIVSASVSGGKLTVIPKKPGETKITIRSSDNPDVYAVCSVICEGELISFVPDADTVAIKTDESIDINLVPVPYYAIYNEPVIELSNNNVSAELSKKSDGNLNLKITGEKAGNSRMKIIIDGKEAGHVDVSCYVDALASLRSIVLSDNSVHLSQEADRFYVSATPRDSSHNTLDITINIDGDAVSNQVASIERIGSSNSFYVSPKNAGSADFFFTAEGNSMVSARLHVEVGGSAVQGSEIRELRAPIGSMTMKTGSSQSVTLFAIPLGSEAGRITWQSNDAAVATVSGNSLEGTVKAVGAGNAMITARDENGHSVTFTVRVLDELSTVNTNIAYMVISSSNGDRYANLTPGKSITLTAQAYDSYDRAISGEMFVWSVSGDTESGEIIVSNPSNKADIIAGVAKGFDSPLIVKAYCVSNPDIKTSFNVYVNTTSAVKPTHTIFVPAYTAFEVALGETIKLPYSFLPLTENLDLAVSASNGYINVSLDTSQKTISITGLSVGRSNVIITDGVYTYTIYGAVLETRSVIDYSITSISISRSYLSYDLADKDLQEINATLYRGSEVISGKVNWTVSDSSLAKLTVNGNKVLVTHLNKVGSTEIIATSADNPSVSATCRLEIIDSTDMAESLRNLIVSSTYVKVEKGKTLQLFGNGIPANVYENLAKTWTSNNPAVATISGNGLVTGVGVGTSMITLSVGGMSDHCMVEVYEGLFAYDVKNIELSETLMRLTQEQMDKNFTVVAKALDSFGNEVSGRDISWTLDETDCIEYVTGYNSFTFSPRNAGSVVVTATCGNAEAKLRIYVGEGSVSADSLRSVYIQPRKIKVMKGGTAVFQGYTIPASYDAAMKWSVPDSLHLYTNGRRADVLALENGTYAIKVSAEGYNEESQLIVQSSFTAGEVTQIRLDKTYISLDMADKNLTKIDATVFKEDKVSNGAVEWIVEDDSPVTITKNGNSLYLTKNRTGSTVITARSIDDPTFDAYLFVDVIDSSQVTDKGLISAMLSASAVNLKVGETYDLSVNTIPANYPASKIYSSSNESVASVSSLGTITAKGGGRAMITVNMEGLVLQCAVTVVEETKNVVPSASYIVIEPATLLIEPDARDPYEVKAAVYAKDGTRLSETVSWNTDGLSGIASVAVQDGSSIWIVAENSGEGVLEAYAYDYDGNRISAKCYVYSGAVIENAYLRHITFDRSDPLYMALGDRKTVNVLYTPNSMIFKGVMWSNIKDNVIYYNKGEDYADIIASEVGEDVLTAISKATDKNGLHLTESLNIVVAGSAAELPQVTSIVIDRSEIVLNLNARAGNVITARAYDYYGNLVPNADIEWYIDNSTCDVAISASGFSCAVVKGELTGSARIYAKCGAVKTYCNVTVVENSLFAGIGLSSSKIRFSNGESVTVAVMGTPASMFTGAKAYYDDESLEISTSDNRNFRIKALKSGTHIVKFTTTVYGEEYSAECVVIVSGGSVSRIVFDKSVVSLSQDTGAYETVKYVCYDTDNNVVQASVESWNVEDSSVCRIEEIDGGVEIYSLNAGATKVTANIGSVSSVIAVSVNNVVSSKTQPDRLTLSIAGMALKAGDSGEIEALYAPYGLSVSAKAVRWSSSNSNVARVQATDTGKAVISAIANGTCVITCQSLTSGESAQCSVVVTNGDVYSIKLDKNNIRLGTDSDTLISAVLIKDGEEFDSSLVSWGFEENGAELQFATESGYSGNYVGSVANIVSSNVAGYSYVIAQYGNAIYRIQIEVSDTGSIITSVSLEYSFLTVEKGESLTISAVALPKIAGIDYSWRWVSDDSNPGELRILSQNGAEMVFLAASEGKGYIEVFALLNGKTVTDKCLIEILESGVIEASYKYRSVKLDKTLLSVSPESEFQYISATLVDENGETEDSVAKWVLTDYAGNEVLAYENGKYYYKNAEYSNFALTKCEEFSDFTVLGDDKRMVRIVPKISGIWYVAAYAPEENGKAIGSKAMVNVSGILRGVALNSSYVHIVRGSEFTLLSTYNPATANVNSYNWTMDGEGLQMVDNPSSSFANFKAVSLGESKVVFTASDALGNTGRAECTVVVHDESYGAGGLRQIAFDNAFKTFSYPYSTGVYRAKAYYMSGSAIDHEDTKYTLYNEIANGIESVATDGKILGPEGNVIASFYVNPISGVSITPVNKGNFRIKAELEQDGETFVCYMYVTIGGQSNAISLSSNRISLYTGGSAEIEVSSDNPSGTGFTATLASETTKQGYKIINGILEGTGKTMDSIFYFSSYDDADKKAFKSENKNIVLKTKSLILNSDDLSLYQRTYGSLEKIVNGTLDSAVMESFPRTAEFRVSDGSSEATLTVVVNLLPDGSMYPVSMQTNQDKIDLQPPFSNDYEINAQVYTISGQETNGTYDWFYSPANDSYDVKDENGNFKYLLNTSGETIDNNLIYCYFDAYGKTLYYKPKMAGIYRMTVINKQNPQLAEHMTVNVKGNVTGISSSVGTSVDISKNNSTDIVASFEPANALAKSVFFIHHVSSSSPVCKFFGDAYSGNSHISAIVNGNTLAVRGIGVTTDSERVRLVYPASGEDYAQMLEWAEMENMVVVLSGDRLSFYDGSVGTDYYLGTIRVVSYQVLVNVTASKTVYSFSSNDNMKIDPDNLTFERVEFSLNADSSVSSQAFSNWDWIDVMIVGNDTGMVYASTVPVSDYIKGESPERLYMASDGLYHPFTDGAVVSESTGVSPEKINYSNSVKTVYSGVVKGEETQLYKVGGKYYYIDAENFRTSEYTTDMQTAAPVKESLIKQGLAAENMNGNCQIQRANSNTFFFKLDRNGIQNESFRIVASLAKNISLKDGYDCEFVKIEDSNIDLLIGGAISGLGFGTLYRSGHGGSSIETLENFGTIDLYEGASCVFVPSFTPVNTHQKDLYWEVVGDQYDSILVDTDYEGRQFRVSAKQLSDLVAQNSDTVKIVAKSKTNPTIQCIYQVTVRCLTKNLNFITVSQRQTNKGTAGAKAFQDLDKVLYPDVASQEEIFCYDTADISGETGNVDAYFVSYTPIPDFKYKYSTTLRNSMIDGVQNGQVSTQVLGTLDKTDIEDGARAFRFVPTGRQYVYDELGNKTDEYFINYGTADLEISYPAINFRKTVKLHYQPSSFRLVFCNEDGSEEYPDYVTHEGKDVIKGAETVMLFPKEKEYLKFADANNASASSLYKLSFSFKNDSQMDANLNLYDFKEEGDNLVYEFPKDDPVVKLSCPKEGMLSEKNGVFSIEGIREGAAYITYTLSFAVTDSNGNIRYKTVKENGETKQVPILSNVTNSIPVYVIRNVNGALARYIAGMYSSNLYSAYFIKKAISAHQMKHWYAVGNSYSVAVGGRTISGLNMYRGKGLFVGDFKETNNLRDMAGYSVTAQPLSEVKSNNMSLPESDESYGALEMSLKRYGRISMNDENNKALNVYDDNSYVSSLLYASEQGMRQSDLDGSDGIIEKALKKGDIDSKQASFLHGNAFASGYNGCKDLGYVVITGETGLKNYPEITRLVLSGDDTYNVLYTEIEKRFVENNIDENGVFDLSETKLTYLKITDWELGKVKKMILPDTLETLVINGCVMPLKKCSVDGKNHRRLFDMEFGSYNNLKTLDLKGNSLEFVGTGSNSGIMLPCFDMTSVMNRTSKLESLDISDNPFVYAYVSDIHCPAFKELKTDDTPNCIYLRLSLKYLHNVELNTGIGKYMSASEMKTKYGNENYNRLMITLYQGNTDFRLTQPDEEERKGSNFREIVLNQVETGTSVKSVDISLYKLDSYNSGSASVSVCDDEVEMKCGVGVDEEHVDNKVKFKTEGIFFYHPVFENESYVNVIGVKSLGYVRFKDKPASSSVLAYFYGQMSNISCEFRTDDDCAALFKIRNGYFNGMKKDKDKIIPSDVPCFLNAVSFETLDLRYCRWKTDPSGFFACYDNELHVSHDGIANLLISNIHNGNNLTAYISCKNLQRIIAEECHIVHIGLLEMQSFDVLDFRDNQLGISKSENSSGWESSASGAFHQNLKIAKFFSYALNKNYSFIEGIDVYYDSTNNQNWTLDFDDGDVCLNNDVLGKFDFSINDIGYFMKINGRNVGGSDTGKVFIELKNLYMLSKEIQIETELNGNGSYSSKPGSGYSGIRIKLNNNIITFDNIEPKEYWREGSGMKGTYVTSSMGADTNNTKRDFTLDENGKYDFLLEGGIFKEGHFGTSYLNINPF